MPKKTVKPVAELNSLVPLSPSLQRKLIKVLVEAKAGGATAEQVTATFRRERCTVFAESVGSYVLESAAPKPGVRLPVAELNSLVACLAAAPNRASGDAIRQQILDGFYGVTAPQHPVDSEKAAFQRVRARSALDASIRACAAASVPAGQVRKIVEQVMRESMPHKKAHRVRVRS